MKIRYFYILLAAVLVLYLFINLISEDIAQPAERQYSTKTLTFEVGEEKNVEPRTRISNPTKHEKEMFWNYFDKRERVIRK